jgi:hypothetical protein
MPLLTELQEALCVMKYPVKYSLPFSTIHRPLYTYLPSAFSSAFGSIV